jgi:hypothetical protein
MSGVPELVKGPKPAGDDLRARHISDIQDTLTGWSGAANGVNEPLLSNQRQRRAGDTIGGRPPRPPRVAMAPNWIPVRRMIAVSSVSVMAGTVPG